MGTREAWKLYTVGSMSCKLSVKKIYFKSCFLAGSLKDPQGIPFSDVFILTYFHPGVLGIAQIKTRTPVTRYLSKKYKHGLHQKNLGYRISNFFKIQLLELPSTQPAVKIC